MSKFLIIYMFFVCIIVLLFSFNSLFNIGPWVFPDLLALFGLCAAILMCRGKREGWIMGMIWSAAQIIVIIIGSSAINRQFLHLGVYSTVNGSGLGFNLVGVLLAIFFVTARKDWEQI